MDPKDMPYDPVIVATDGIGSSISKLKQMAEAAEILGLHDLALELRFVCKSLSIDLEEIIEQHNKGKK